MRSIFKFKGIVPALAGIVFLFSECLTGCGTDRTAPAEDGWVAAEAGTEASVTATEETGELSVYVCGAVRSPGVYTLPQGSRICDAVDAAGGMNGDACEDYRNLAEYLTDAQMIRIPTKEEAEALSEETAQESPAGEEAGDNGRIHLNTASKEELKRIPGIGDSRAEQIIAYREQNGRFEAVEDVMKVSGIGEGLFARMRDYICL